MKRTEKEIAPEEKYVRMYIYVFLGYIFNRYIGFVMIIIAVYIHIFSFSSNIYKSWLSIHNIWSMDMIYDPKVLQKELGSVTSRPF